MPKRSRANDALSPSQDVESRVTASPELDIEDEPTTETCTVCHDEKLSRDLFVVCTNGHSFCIKCILQLKKSDTSRKCPMCRERMGLSSRYEQRMVNGNHCLHAIMRSRDGSREVLCPFSPYYRNGDEHDSYKFLDAFLNKMRALPEVDLREVYENLLFDLTEVERIITKLGKCEILVFVKKGTATPAEMRHRGTLLANAIYKIEGKPGAVPQSVKIVEGELMLVTNEVVGFSGCRTNAPIDDRILFLQALKNVFEFAAAKLE